MRYSLKRTKGQFWHDSRLSERAYSVNSTGEIEASDLKNDSFVFVDQHTVCCVQPDSFC